MPRETPPAVPGPEADPWRLHRFVEAQAAVYETACAEIAEGCKRSHWMWFVFPQLRALGRSHTAQHYGLQNADEARAYLAHPLLGARLTHCAGLVDGVRGRTAHEIFGSPDDLKLRSCMTLFAAVAPGAPVFRSVLERYYGGRADEATLGFIRA